MKIKTCDTIKAKINIKDISKDIGNRVLEQSGEKFLKNYAYISTVKFGSARTKSRVDFTCNSNQLTKCNVELPCTNFENAPYFLADAFTHG